MHLSRTCAAGSVAEIRLSRGWRADAWRALAVLLGLAAIVGADLPGPLLAVALVLLWCLARWQARRAPRWRLIRLSAETLTLVGRDGCRQVALCPPRGWLLPGSITLASGRWRRVQVFSDQCEASDFRALRRLVSGAGG